MSGNPRWTASQPTDWFVTGLLTGLQMQAVTKRRMPLSVETVGGLMAPLREGFAVRDPIVKHSREAVVIAAQRLGTGNPRPSPPVLCNRLNPLSLQGQL